MPDSIPFWNWIIGSLIPPVVNTLRISSTPGLDWKLRVNCVPPVKSTPNTDDLLWMPFETMIAHEATTTRNVPPNHHFHFPIKSILVWGIKDNILRIDTLFVKAAMTVWHMWVTVTAV